MRVPRVVVLWSETRSDETADLLVRREATRWSGAPAGSVRVFRLCPRCGSGLHGRPVIGPVPGHVVPQVSISRAGGLTVVALSDAGPVGVDVELADAAGSADLTRTWVRKESLLKATGQGLAVDPSRLRIGDPVAGACALLEWPDPDPPRGPVWILDVALPDTHVAAVTALGTTRPALDVRQPEGEREARSPTANGRTARPAALP